MHFSNIILSLTVAASAADIRMRFEADCKGGFAVCSNIGPSICCDGVRSDLKGSPSAGFVNMPPNSLIVAWQSTNNKFNPCGVEKTREQLRGDNGCLRPGGSATYSGASWQQGRKRSLAGVDGVQQCVGSQKPDVLVLDNGAKYQLDGMDDGLFNELYAHALNGTAMEDISDAFVAYEAAV